MKRKDIHEEISASFYWDAGHASGVVEMADYGGKVIAFSRYVWATEFIKGRVLDAGCATGYGSNILHRHGFNVVGVDFLDYHIKFAKGFYPQIEFHCEDLLNFTGEFDWITSFEVLEHMPDPDLYVHKLKSLAPNILVSTPYCEPPKDSPIVHVINNIDEKQLKKWFGSDIEIFYQVRWSGTIYKIIQELDLSFNEIVSIMAKVHL